MTLQALPQAGKGGSGIPDVIPAAIRELQGLKFNILAGAAANTKLNLAAIRQEDTLVEVLEFATGALPVSRLGVASISDVRASGTLTFASAINNDTFTIAGRVYTLKTAGTANPLNNEINLGASDTLTAAAVVAHVNKVDPRVILSNAAGVVTVRAFAEGTAPNSFTLVGGARITASGGTLSGGTVTGGVSINDDTSSNAVLVVWFDKR